MDVDQVAGESGEQQTELSLREEIEKNVAEINAAAEIDANDVTPAATEPLDKTATTPASKTTETTAPVDKTAKTAPAATTDKPATAADAPRSWNATEKAHWPKVPPEVQAVIARREEEVHRAITGMGQDAALGRKINEVSTPYLPMLRAEGADPVVAFQSLLQTAYMLRTAPQAQKDALFGNLARQYGVNLTAAAGDAPRIDPTIQALQTQVQRMEQERQQAQTQQHQQFQASLQGQIDAFKNDPKNEFYEQARPVMSALLAGGQATDLQQAYDMACNAIPDVRSTIQQRLTADSEAKRAAEAKAKADAKRRAGASITGSPGAASPTTPNGKSDLSLRDEIKANYQAALNS